MREFLLTSLSESSKFSAQRPPQDNLSKHCCWTPSVAERREAQHGVHFFFLFSFQISFETLSVNPHFSPCSCIPDSSPRSEFLSRLVVRSPPQHTPSSTSCTSITWEQDSGCPPRALHHWLPRNCIVALMKCLCWLFYWNYTKSIDFQILQNQNLKIKSFRVQWWVQTYPV